MTCLYRKMRHKWVRYESFLFPVSCRIAVLLAVVLEIVTQGVCLCMTIPRATARKTAPLYFIRIRHSQDIFLCIYFLKITYLWRTLRRHARCFFKDQSHVCHKDLPRVYQKQNLALSWFKPASTLSSKYECWCEFEKDLKVFRYSFSETIPIFFIRLSANILNILHSKGTIKFKLKCTSHGCKAIRINLEKLG